MWSEDKHHLTRDAVKSHTSRTVSLCPTSKSFGYLTPLSRQELRAGFCAGLLHHRLEMTKQQKGHFEWLRLTVTSEVHLQTRRRPRRRFTSLRKNWTCSKLLFTEPNSFAKRDKGSPVLDHFLVVAKMTEESRVEQVHDSVLLPSDVQIHGHPVIGRRGAKRAGRERNSRF